MVEGEVEARCFFVSRDVEPDRDDLAANGTRVLAWPLQGDPEAIEATCRSVLVELCGVAPEEGLDLTDEESR